MNGYGKWIALGVIALVALYVMSSYNGLVAARNNVGNKWGDVQATYQRRIDLANEIMPAVVGSAAQETAVFTLLKQQAQALAGAFNKDGSGQPVAPKTDGEAAQLNQKVQGFNQAYLNFAAYAASNPQMVSQQAYNNFIAQMEGSENRVNVARRDYNQAVRDYKNAVQMFPGNLVAGFFGFAASDFAFFQADAESQKAPVVTFPTPNIPK